MTCIGRADRVPVTETDAPEDFDRKDNVREIREDSSGAPRVKAAVEEAMKDGIVTHGELVRVEKAAHRRGGIDPSDVAQMKRLLDQPVRTFGVAGRVKQHVLRQEAQLRDGDVIGDTYVHQKDGQNLIREHFITRLDVPFSRVLERYDPTTWSLNLPHWRGGEVIMDSQRMEMGCRITELTERMRLDSGDRVADLAGLATLDMTKKTRVTEDPQAGIVRIEWSVYHSDDGSVQRDDGFIELKRMGDKTLVTCKSDHRINPRGAAMLRPFLPEGPDDWLPNEMADGLGRYFRDALTGIRDIATGQRAGIRADEAREKGLLRE